MTEQPTRGATRYNFGRGANVSWPKCKMCCPFIRVMSLAKVWNVGGGARSPPSSCAPATDQLTLKWILRQPAEMLNGFRKCVLKSNYANSPPTHIILISKTLLAQLCRTRDFAMLQNDSAKFCSCLGWLPSPILCVIKIHSLSKQYLSYNFLSTYIYNKRM